MGVRKQRVGTTTEVFCCSMRDNQRTDALWLRGDGFVERCQGFADGLGVKLGKQMIDSSQDPAEKKLKFWCIYMLILNGCDFDAGTNLG